MSGDLPTVFTLPADSPEQDRGVGMSAFLRLDDRGRVELTAMLLDACYNHGPYNEAAVGGAFRSAWDSEPFLDGCRFGSFFSAVAADPDLATDLSMGEIAMDWGEHMMNEGERRRLETLRFPLTVFRGGVGDPRSVSHGVSWTTDYEVARFYATTWPTRWGIVGHPQILAHEVDRRDVAALFDDRGEHEVLVPDGGPIDGPFDLR